MNVFRMFVLNPILLFPRKERVSKMIDFQGSLLIRKEMIEDF